MSTPLVILFLKAPEPGKAKTRLAAEVGEEVAAAVEEAFAEDKGPVFCVGGDCPNLCPDTFSEPLAVGADLPDAVVRRAEGSPVRLTDLSKDQKTVMVFYRGGWCAFCNAHLSGLIQIEEKLRNDGWQIIAISPDKPAKVREVLENSEISYQLLSDSAMNAAKAFGLAFTVDDETVEHLKSFDIDIEADSGKDHRMLPVPGVFLVDESGKIIFAHHDPDYRERLSNEELLKAADLD